MNRLELEFARRKRGFTKAEMAQAIGKSVVSYCKKERGAVKFSDNEKLIVANKLELTPDQFNAIFFDGSIPNR